MRVVIDFNDDWAFHRGDAATAHTPDFDHSNWRSVLLPHDWSIEGPFEQQWASATGFLPGGIGWYRKTFEVPPDFAGKRVYIHFDGVYCNSQVWLNGQLLGVRPNGHTPFRYDVTPYLLLEGPNTVAVRVDHTQFADSRWYNGSGIYRKVQLIATEPIHIQQWGIFATTPVVTTEEAQIHVAVTVQNHTESPTDVQVVNTLVAPDGTTVAEATATVLLLEATRTMECLITLVNPVLWSVENPALYHLYTVVQHDGVVLDRQETRIGIRSIRYDATQGFFLNEQNIKFKGVCLHDDAGALGVAVPVKVWKRRLEVLKAAGVNAIRMAHNPHLPELYDLCDEMGFLVQEEAFDEWEMGKNKWIQGWNVGTPGKDGYHSHFTDWSEIDLRDVILHGRNHPCIVMWSVGNEIDYPNDPYTHEILETGTNPQSFGRGYKPDFPHADRLAEIGKRLVAIAKRYDTTRPITAALAAALISNETGLADVLDVVGYNYQEYRYPEDHAKWPSRILYGSENGMREEFWRAVTDNDYISGQFLWTGIDYLGEAHIWPSRSNGAGLLDLAGSPKTEYYFRQSLWSDTPMIYIGTREVPTGDQNVGIWTHKKADPVWAGTEGEPVRVVAFTNCTGAELFVNGQSVGVKTRQPGDSPILVWDIPYQPGTLTAKGIADGEAVAISSLQTSGEPHTLQATIDTDVLKADGKDLAHVEVVVVDAEGVPVFSADHEVTWTVEGPARLLGLESGDHHSHEDYKGNKRKAYHGRLLGYLQSTKESGTVTVRLRAPGLEEVTVSFHTVA